MTEFEELSQKLAALNVSPEEALRDWLKQHETKQMMKFWKSGVFWNWVLVMVILWLIMVIYILTKP